MLLPERLPYAMDARWLQDDLGAIASSFASEFRAKLRDIDILLVIVSLVRHIQ